VELQRLANAYRLEMARIKDDPSLVSGAPRADREKLQTATAALQVRLDSYATALGAARAETRCTNTCSLAGDGDCDDGGSGSEYTICSLGSDCVD
jgi:hypothetical protein